MVEKNIRWLQRLSSYKKAFRQLERAYLIFSERELSELEQQGFIQAFEFTHELAWNVMKDYFVYQGNNSITGSRDATKEAFKNDLIIKGEIWIQMILSRNKTSYTYDSITADEIVKFIGNSYFPLFKGFLHKMESISAEKQIDL